MSARFIQLFGVSSIAVLAMGWLVTNVAIQPESITEIQQSQIIGGPLWTDYYCSIGSAPPCTTCTPGTCMTGTLTIGGPQVCIYHPTGLVGSLRACLGGACSYWSTKGGTGCTTVANCGGGSAVPPTAAPGAIGGANSMCPPTSWSQDGLQIYTCGGPGPCVLGGAVVCNTCI